jgi:hypothetical protein
MLGAREDYDWCDEATRNGTHGACRRGEQKHETRLKNEHCQKCEVDNFMGGGSSDSGSGDGDGFGATDYWEDDEGRGHTWLGEEEEFRHPRPVCSRIILGTMARIVTV